MPLVALPEHTGCDVVAALRDAFKGFMLQSPTTTITAKRKQRRSTSTKTNTEKNEGHQPDDDSVDNPSSMSSPVKRPPSSSSSASLLASPNTALRLEREIAKAEETMRDMSLLAAGHKVVSRHDHYEGAAASPDAAAETARSSGGCGGIEAETGKITSKKKKQKRNQGVKTHKQSRRRPDAASISSFPQPPDRLYVLQLRAVLVGELALNLHSFEAPLDKWLKGEEQRTASLVHTVTPLFSRFLPSGPAVPLFHRPSQASPAPTGFEMSLIDQQRLLFGPNNTKQANLLASARKVAWGWSSSGTAPATASRGSSSGGGGGGGGNLLDVMASVLGGDGGSSSSSSSRDGGGSGSGGGGHVLEQASQRGVTNEAHPTGPGGGLGCGWEFATPAAMDQADALVDAAKERLRLQKQKQKQDQEQKQKQEQEQAMDANTGAAAAVAAAAAATYESKDRGGEEEEKEVEEKGNEEEEVLRSLWCMMSEACEAEASVRMKRKQALAATQLQALESYRVVLVGLLANRPLPSVNTRASAAAAATMAVDSSEKLFHKRFRISAEPLLFDCAASLKVTVMVAAASNPNHNSRNTSSHPLPGGGSGGGELLPDYSSALPVPMQEKVVRRENGRLFVTFAHLWFDSPPSLLKGECQVSYVCFRRQFHLQTCACIIADNLNALVV
jgi:hypothetical protein